MYDNHPIGVWYNGSKWAIFNQDLTAMPVNAAFNVFVLTGGCGRLCSHGDSGQQQLATTPRIDNPLTNGNPNAIVFVTPNCNPGGGLRNVR